MFPMEINTSFDKALEIAEWFKYLCLDIFLYIYSQLLED